jgi:pre-mRNA-processing factor SLU7
LKRLEERERAAMDADGSKRKYNSLDACGEVVTAEEMEAFRIKKSRGEDPLAAQGAGTGGYDYL